MNDIRKRKKSEEISSPKGTIREVAVMAAEQVKLKRRSLLQYIILGSGTFLVGKILGPSISLFSSNHNFGAGTDFKNFRVEETDKSLSFFDKVGNKILVIDK